jgi:hypothetical protein
VSQPRPIQLAHEHEFEAAHGLPEALPAGERILWQGAPEWRALARDALHVRTIAIYFAVMVGLRGAFVLGDGGSALNAAIAMAWLLPAVVFALTMLSAVAWLSARSTAYTLTNRRVVMRVGIVLTLTFNLPLRSLSGAGLRKHDNASTGDIPLQLAGESKIAWIHLWPHVRPWRVARPEPMLRSIANVHEVAQMLTEAWSAETGMGAKAAPVQAANDARARHLQPVAAGAAL